MDEEASFPSLDSSAETVQISNVSTLLDKDELSMIREQLNIPQLGVFIHTIRALSMNFGNSEVIRLNNISMVNTIRSILTQVFGSSDNLALTIANQIGLVFPGQLRNFAESLEPTCAIESGPSNQNDEISDLSMSSAIKKKRDEEKADDRGLTKNSSQKSIAQANNLDNNYVDSHLQALDDTKSGGNSMGTISVGGPHVSTTSRSNGVDSTFAPATDASGNLPEQEVSLSNSVEATGINLTSSANSSGGRGITNDQGSREVVPLFENNNPNSATVAINDGSVASSQADQRSWPNHSTSDTWEPLSYEIENKNKKRKGIKT
eukprot:CAMPEP_0198303736 /NCGR_PEP_ID=MMETSP1449-20131203/57042_1 /TAXON_ID=420275 /ORGANISM="Attheya septentrionalis, Strain CCMP2084" /LENGTH=319 /DNA_ID=CAMNT_0044006243 /DNA_START=390 /DNA_END=1348 /DNA_ORIENTATION=+